MKKIYIKPLSTCVVLNTSDSIMDNLMLTGSQRTSTDDPDGGNKTEEQIGSGGNTSSLPAWGGHAKQHSAWNTWDD